MFNTVSTNIILSKNNFIALLEKMGDTGQYAIPAGVGLYALFSGKTREAIAMGILGYIQHLEVFAIKHYFPRVRPKKVFSNKSEDFEKFSRRINAAL